MYTHNWNSKIRKKKRIEKFEAMTENFLKLMSDNIQAVQRTSSRIIARIKKILHLVISQIAENQTQRGKLNEAGRGGNTHLRE